MSQQKTRKGKNNTGKIRDASNNSASKLSVADKGRGRTTDSSQVSDSILQHFSPVRTRSGSMSSTGRTIGNSSSTPEQAAGCQSKDRPTEGTSQEANQQSQQEHNNGLFSDPSQPKPSEILKAVHANGKNIERLSGDVHANGKNIERLSGEVEKLCATVLLLQLENDKMRKELDKRKQNEETLRAELESVKRRAELADERSNFVEQYGRNYNIRIFNVAEPDNETPEQCEETVLKLFHVKLGLSHIKKCDIDAVHRLGQKRSGANSPRGVIVRFISRKTRQEVLSNRRKLKQSTIGQGKSIVITEDLTKQNYQLYCMARDSSVTERAWSIQGKILIKAKNGKIKRITRRSDLDDPTLRCDSSYTPRRVATDNSTVLKEGKTRLENKRQSQLSLREESETENETKRHSESEFESEADTGEETEGETDANPAKTLWK